MGVSDNTNYQILIAFLSVIGILGWFVILWITFVWWMKRYKKNKMNANGTSNNLDQN